jgi:uncharacterized membrane protein HdeD (DUF308 family)
MAATRFFLAGGVILVLGGFYFVMFGGDTDMRIFGFLQVLSGVCLIVSGLLQQRHRAR